MPYPRANKDNQIPTPSTPPPPPRRLYIDMCIRSHSIKRVSHIRGRTKVTEIISSQISTRLHFLFANGDEIYFMLLFLKIFLDKTPKNCLIMLFTDERKTKILFTLGYIEKCQWSL